MKVEFSIYRYNPDFDDKPRMQDYTLTVQEGHDRMLLDALIQLKEQDPSLSFRHSCRDGVGGSDGVNMNGKNGLACITLLSRLRKRDHKVVIRPLPGLPVICDLVVDMGQFYAQYEKIKPFLINDGRHPTAREHLQSPEQRPKMDGLYECILCTCCSTSCPSFWWNPDKFIGPAWLLASYRFLIDNRDTYQHARLDHLNDAFSIFLCHSIMNYVSVCHKGLNPTKAIAHIKSMLVNYRA